MAYDVRSRAFIALAVSGIGVAVYHAYDEINFAFNSCNLSNVFSCQAVFGRGYDKVLGVNFWVYGVVWFPLVLLVGIWAVNRYGTPLGSVVAPFLMIGNIFTIYPWYIEIKLLNGTYCPVCISLYVINYVLTFVALASTSSGAEESSEEKGEEAEPPKPSA